jgi:hypothetical protein
MEVYLMQNQQPHQCDICFQSYGPFSFVRILPVTPIITLSGTATPIHVRTPGARISICHYCRQSYSNIEPCNESPDPDEPAESDEIIDILEASETSETPVTPDRPEASEYLNTPEAPSLPIHESDIQLVAAEPLIASLVEPQVAVEPLIASLVEPQKNDSRNSQSVEPAARPALRLLSPEPPCLALSLVPTTLLPSCYIAPYTLHQRASPVRIVSFVTSATFSICNRIRSPPLITMTSSSLLALEALCVQPLSNF